MKIERSVINLASRHSLVEKDESRESVRVWGKVRQLNSPGQFLQQKRQDLVQITRQAVSLMRRKLRETEALERQEQAVFSLSEEDKQRISLLEVLLGKLTGKKVKFIIPDEEQLRAIGAGNIKLQELPSLAGPTAQSSNSQPVGWGFAYDSFQSHYEAETTTFNANGIVKTADGKDIAFSLDLTMSRQFYSQQSIRVRAGDTTLDPLVINFDGPSAGLTETKVQFDLDADGTLDNISFVRPGSGFLALDRNEDGTINDGQELFGPQSGDGFADLALYDADGNMWIDENDPIFSKLRIWTKDTNGNDQLLALGVTGVGAIYLGHVATEFALKDSANNHDGQIRSTGLFLKENGAVGTIQHVDLVL